MLSERKIANAAQTLTPAPTAFEDMSHGRLLIGGEKVQRD